MIQAIRQAQQEFDWDTKVFVQVGTIKAAEEAIKQGVDVLVVQGTDAGGHQWAQGASLVSLLPEVRDKLLNTQNRSIAVLAAGGIVDGRGCVAALGLGEFCFLVPLCVDFTNNLYVGADGIVMGTRVSLIHLGRYGVVLIRSSLLQPLNVRHHLLLKRLLYLVAMVESRLLNPRDMMCFSQLMSFRGNMTGELLLELIMRNLRRGSVTMRLFDGTMRLGRLVMTREEPFGRKFLCILSGRAVLIY